MKHTRRATTLIEVLIVIAILGFFSLFAMAKWPSTMHKPADVVEEVARLRAQAIRSFQSATTWISLHDTSFAVTALPDGTVIGFDDLQSAKFRGLVSTKEIARTREEAARHAHH